MNDQDSFVSSEPLAQEELMRANEAATVAFSRSLRGYNPDEVDDFLDDVAESLQRYAELLLEKDQTIAQLKEKLSDYDDVRESLEEALRVTREESGRAVEQANLQSSSLMDDARRQAETLLADAQNQAAATLAAARENAVKLVNQTEELRRRRDAFWVQSRQLVADYTEALARLAPEEEKK